MPAVTPALAARRKAVFAACRQLGLDDDARRAMLKSVAGVDSTTKLDMSSAQAVLDHLRKAGATRPKPTHGSSGEWGFVFKCLPDRQGHLRKIYRLAERCGTLLTPPAAVAPKAWVEGAAEQMVGCTTALEFCDAEILHKLVQALEIHCKRHGV